MKRFLAALFLLASCSFAHAQDAYVVSICGAVPVSYTNPGAVLPITVDTTGRLCLSGGGGGGTPGGSNTQLQYNAAGAFGGISGATSNGTTVTFASGDLILSGATSGSATLNAPATGGGTLTLPAGSTTLAGLSVAQTWSAVQTFNASDLVLGGIASTQCLQANSSGVISGTGSACASGGTPAGANTNVQFNNSGAFGGDSGFTYTTPGQVTIALGSITTNLKALTITGTFNASGTTFDAPLLMNITNTASNSSSLLADIQVGGSTFWDVNVQGQTQQAGLAWIKTQTGGIAFGNAFDASLSYGGANVLSVDNGNFNTATGTLKLSNLQVSTSLFGFNGVGANVSGSNITETPALSTGGGAPGNWIVQNGFSGTGAAGTATISNASPAVITEAAHNYFIGEPFTLTTTGTLPTGFSTLTTYYIISAGFGTGAFEASTSFGGAAVNTSSAGSGTHTVNPGGVVTISNASPAVVTLTNHGLVPGMQVQFSANGGTLPTGISAATNYFVISAGLTVNTFEISTTLNGSAVNTSTAGSGTFTVLYQGGSVQNPAYAVGTWGPSQLTEAQQTPVNSPALNVTQLFNNGSVVGTTTFTVAQQQLLFGNGTLASGLKIYNTVDSIASPVNYERGIFDWTTVANQLTIGTVAGGTGTGRKVFITANSATAFQSGVVVDPSLATYFLQNGNSADFGLNGVGVAVLLTSGPIPQLSIGLSGGGPVGATTVGDSGIQRVVAKVISFTDGTNTANANGWMQWGGQSRVTADVTFTSTTTLGTVTGLSVNVQAGRTYCFVGELSWTDAAAGGLQLAISGTSTATNIIYDGYIVDSAANGIKGNAQATALGGVVASSVTTGTAGHARISGCDTVNAAGTLLVQAAQNTSNATATTIKRGSYFYVYDSP